MKFETSGKKTKLGLTEQILKIFKITKTQRNECTPSSCAFTEESQPEQSRNISAEAYRLATRRWHEVETQKAALLIESRHNRWKAGGPV